MKVEEMRIVERMLGRTMSEKEIEKISRAELLDALRWARNKFIEEQKLRVVAS